MTFTEAEAAAKKLADGGTYSVSYQRQTDECGRQFVRIYAHTHLMGGCQIGSGATYQQAIDALRVNVASVYEHITPANQPPTCAQQEG